MSVRRGLPILLLCIFSACTVMSAGLRVHTGTQSSEEDSPQLSNLEPSGHADSEGSVKEKPLPHLKEVYTAIKHLGNGANGNVYEVEDINNAKYAMKILKPARQAKSPTPDDEARCQRFLTECNWAKILYAAAPQKSVEGRFKQHFMQCRDEGCLSEEEIAESVKVGPQSIPKPDGEPLKLVTASKNPDNMNGLSGVMVFDLMTGIELKDLIVAGSKVNTFAQLLVLTQQSLEIVTYMQEARLPKDTRSLGLGNWGDVEREAIESRTGLIHTDIKPENLMITNGGIVKAIDYGSMRPCGAEIREITMKFNWPSWGPYPEGTKTGTSPKTPCFYQDQYSFAKSILAVALQVTDGSRILPDSRVKVDVALGRSIDNADWLHAHIDEEGNQVDDPRLKVEFLTVISEMLNHENAPDSILSHLNKRIVDDDADNLVNVLSTAKEQLATIVRDHLEVRAAKEAKEAEEAARLLSKSDDTDAEGSYSTMSSTSLEDASSLEEDTWPSTPAGKLSGFGGLSKGLSIDIGDVPAETITVDA